MAKCHHRLALAWAAAGLLVGGCATPSHQPDADDQAKESRTVDEKLVQAHAHYAQGLIHDLNQEPDQALEEFSKAAELDPGNEDLVIELTRRYLQLKQPEKALSLLQKAAAVPGASGEIYTQLGLVYSRLGKTDQAIAAGQKAVKNDPKSIAGYRNLFVIELQKGPPREALKVLDQALKVSDVNAEFLVELGGLYGNLVREAPAMKAPASTNGLIALYRALKLKPTSPRLQTRLADGLNELGDTTNAAQIYLQLLDKYSEMPPLRNDLHTKLADIYLRNNEAKKAEEQLQAVVRENPNSAQAYFLLGSVAQDQKKFPEAALNYEKALLLDPDFEQGYYSLAAAQLDLNKPKEALATLEKSRAKFARGFRSEFLTAVAYVRDKDYTNAVAHFISAESLALAAEPDALTPYFYFEAGAAYERKGDFDTAEKYFEKCLKLSPKLAEALNYYGYMLADRGIKLDRAREMIDEAVKQEPKNAAFLDSLGWVMFRQGKAQDALEQVQKAIDLSEEPDATLFEHLGDIYASLKQMDKAREAWRKSLKVEPNDKIQKKLDGAGGKTSA